MIALDADRLAVTEINRLLKEAVHGDQAVTILNPRSRHHLGVGVLGPLQLTIEGNAGYFCGCLCEGIKLHVRGSVGWYSVDNLMDGEVVVDHDAGSCIAPGMRGGVLVIRGNMGSRCGQVMKSGTIIVGGNSGFMTGFMMIGGTIVVAGDTGDLLGHYMVGGTIYTGGRVGSTGVDVQEVACTEEENVYLGRLLDHYGLARPPAWRKFVSAQKHHHY
ncbi:tributyrin esterase [Desulfofundulus thermobenzoicus]|uniref:Tributyrin esterase n=1 Tax=Desulfofundulus thermobenzoicus TaxID=29376 RepID=A0A6N7IPJ3_9FIRM|nr:tributyrin esterase [Desulfofundulus thermobenzoicus]MQL51956.1 tributyrin esterase [Desulfofundulus thermobenzoicus]